jgi:integrase
MAVMRDPRNGIWRYRKQVNFADGRTKRISGKPNVNTRAAAEAAERKHIERVERDPDLAFTKRKEAPDLKTFIEEIWWPKYELGGGKRGKNSVTTLGEKRVHIELHIVPRLGHLALDRVNHEAVTKFFGELRTDGYHPKGRRPTSEAPAAIRKRLSRAKKAKDRPQGLGEKSIRNIRATLRTILDAAVKWTYLKALPELPDVVVPEAAYDWYQPGEAAQLLQAARDPWERTLIMFALHTGARMGEQRALRWTDVDFQLRRIYIRRSAPGALKVVKAPKSNKQRWVDLTPELSDALKAIRHGGELVFCRENGSMLQPGQFHEALWAAQKAAGLRRIRWHELRHSYASILVSGGAPLALIRGLLGHSSIVMTEKYAHLSAGNGSAYLHLLSAAVPENRGNQVATEVVRPS